MRDLKNQYKKAPRTDNEPENWTIQASIIASSNQFHHVFSQTWKSRADRTRRARFFSRAERSLNGQAIAVEWNPFPFNFKLFAQRTKKKSPKSRLFAAVSIALDYYYYILLLVSITPSDRAFWKESLREIWGWNFTVNFPITIASRSRYMIHHRELFSSRRRWSRPIQKPGDGWSLQFKVAPSEGFKPYDSAVFFRLRILTVEGKKSVAICLSMGDRTIVHANISGITVDNTYYHGWWRWLNMGSLSWSKTQREWWVWGFWSDEILTKMSALSLLLAYLTAWLNSLE